MEIGCIVFEIFKSVTEEADRSLIPRFVRYLRKNLAVLLALRS